MSTRRRVEPVSYTHLPLARRGLITFATAANATGEPRTDVYKRQLNRYTVKIDREALAAGEIRGQKIDRRVQYFLGLGDLEAGETFKITHNYGVP